VPAPHPPCSMCARVVLRAFSRLGALSFTPDRAACHRGRWYVLHGMKVRRSVLLSALGAEDRRLRADCAHVHGPPTRLRDERRMFDR
jgi:hypothetical protein